MIKLCGKTIAYLLKRNFEASLQKGTFPSCWKKANIVPVQKKEDKSLLRNYRPISLLPIFGKIFEGIIFLDSTKLKIVWIKITTNFKRPVSIIL